MVDDLESFHAGLLAVGHRPAEIESMEFHRFFKVREPGGHEVTINSTHVSDQPV